MKTRILPLLALAFVVLASSACRNAYGVPYVSYVESNVPAVSERAPMPTIIFCGVHPDDPQAARKVRVLAVNAGGDVSMGPCMAPDWSVYTVSEPGVRYVDRATYLRLVELNASVGMQTIVYDADIWSDDEAVRNEAIEFWRPHAAWLFAFDMGDEADPASPDWQTMIHRFEVIAEFVSPAIGIGGFTNHLGSAAVIEQALEDMPSHQVILSFDAYAREGGVPAASLDLALQFKDRTGTLVCAVNALTHAHFAPNATEIRNDMRQHRNHGCDMTLIFGGVAPYLHDLSADPYFGGSSLVTYSGNATPWARAVLEGAK